METKKTILVVEDETPLRNALCDKLAGEGFHTLPAKNGVEGLQVALQEHPDLILLDVVMPLMDGVMMLQKLRADTWGAGAHVIILTNLSDTDSVAKAMDQEVFEYIIKSNIKIEELVKRVKEALGGE
ncbi:response regulator transcription factor [Candidatus Campbellbacteria bacterium]|nr:MAG: response regulator transcription factor [Candidatus Campbellbacteria bacterium]